ncbi:MAG: S49 family peptidase [Xanthomonadaceae bacterium]|nr:S49 family peptidase [Xanthomonadaceae bacterium]
MASNIDRNNDDRWERAALERIATELVREQRRARRWNIFFRLAFLAYLIALLVFASPAFMLGSKSAVGRHTAVIKIDGVISEGSPASAESIIESLNAAIKAPGVAGIILQINSPGGSPVQSGIINDEIRRLRGLHPDIPIHAVVGDMCTSGAYYVAVAAERIFVDKASLVGSIGVLIDGFGFTGAMEKLGIERRLYTAGEHKGFLDPFSPVQSEDVAHVRTLLNEVHQQFIQVVRDGRGDRLADDPRLFTGLIWSGEQSIALGLADAIGSVHSVARDVIGAEKLVDYTRQVSLLTRLADRVGASIARQLETRLWGQLR